MRARIDLSEASNLTGKGAANDLLIIVSEASHLELADFPVHNANVTLSSASYATINLDGRLDATVSGASHLRYIGELTSLGNIQKSDDSTIEKKQ